jgi:hypothetical protein
MLNGAEFSLFGCLMMFCSALKTFSVLALLLARSASFNLILGLVPVLVSSSLAWECQLADWCTAEPILLSYSFIKKLASNRLSTLHPQKQLIIDRKLLKKTGDPPRRQVSSCSSCSQTPCWPPACSECLVQQQSCHLGKDHSAQPCCL